MARPLRVEYEGAFYHVLNRGLERREIFRDRKDYEKFLSILSGLHGRYKIRVHSYCLMPNHYHLYLETPQGKLSRVMQQLDGVYTQSFNRRYQRVGPLLQGRYKAILVEKESYSLEISRYIHLNPVKANLAEKPEGWEWSSYRIFMGKSSGEEFLETDWLLGQMSRQRRQARVLFERFTLEGLKERWEPFDQVKGGSILGGKNFCQWVHEVLRKEEPDPEISGIRGLSKAVKVEELIRLAQQMTKEESLRRKLTVYALRRYSPLSLNEIGEKVGGMKYQAVSQSVRRLEETAQRDRHLENLLKMIDAKCTM
jgi:REP element-mobilizing transposase RayT